MTIRVLTWHVHGNYLWYLSHAPIELYLPVRPDRSDGYAGRTTSFPWPSTVHEVPAEAVAGLDVDLVLHQSHRNWQVDRFELLSDAQRRLPQIVLEHDPPRGHPTDTAHPVDDPHALLVHVTAFNRLMWDSGRTPTCVVEHGVVVPAGLRATGELARGAVVVNNLDLRGRRLGLDLFLAAREQLPLDLIGMGADRLGGIGEVPPPQLPYALANYRFLFTPIRYTSLGLAICEAMALGLPVVGLATTELTSVVRDGVEGYIDLRPERLHERMAALIADRDLARRLGDNARTTAAERFGIERFAADWMDVFERAVARRLSTARSG